MELRPYQRQCVEAVYEHLRTRDDNPCAVVPTAGGKTPIMATICKDAVLQWNGRILILAHVKELLEQSADKLRAVCPEIEFGIYSAGLKRRDTRNPVTLLERGRGVPIGDMERRWSIKNLAGLEEQWRDRQLWLLSALSRILETRCFFYCLREHCDADLERIRRVTRIFRAMQLQLFGLQEHLKFCSPLGSILRSMRRTSRARIGPATIRRLEDAGITTLATLSTLGVDQLTALGVRRSAAVTIRNYLRRRAQ